MNASTQARVELFTMIWQTIRLDKDSAKVSKAATMLVDEVCRVALNASDKAFGLIYAARDFTRTTIRLLLCNQRALQWVE